MLGDFYFQSNALAMSKKKRYPEVLLHSGIYLAVSAAVAGIFLSNILFFCMVMLSVSHWIIDSIKFLVEKRLNSKNTKNESVVYVVDQLVHLVCIAAIAILFYNGGWHITAPQYMTYAMNSLGSKGRDLIQWAAIVLVVYKPANVTIKKLLASYRPIATAKEESGSKSAGAFIGVLERIILIIFMAIQQYAAIGLVLTAKSIARYNKIAEDKEFAEYYLLGTLLSTLYAIVVYIVFF